ncbi:MAG: tRNA (adenosine(37)-N6)-threonylcarbamoyltransferase complex ATPase subunit type 1 TsaE [Patescibacteria group bacterium]|nr:tRNA (adenosine(37)-N6)-threonylcarbamoyltransferase complex ATPase subunit type 1 TsaE [Patescibacteria group bacterium]
MLKKYLTNNPSQTEKIATQMGKKFLKTSFPKKAIILGLEGELGSGKTTFLKAFARGLGIRKKVLSPTFVIMKKFKVSKGKTYRYFYHFDCYRIKNSKEFQALGFREIFSDPKNIIAVEWANKIKKIMPKHTIWMKFEFIDEKKRNILINNH